MRTRTVLAIGVLVLAASGAAYALSRSSSASSHSGLRPSAAISPGTAGPGGADDPSATVATSRQTIVSRYEVFEHTFVWTSSGYSNPWEQVRLTVRVRSPTGRRYQIDGFYYGPNRWKVRFAPDQLGHWSWRALITDGRRSDVVQGAFRVVPSRNPGFVRESSYNRFRWTFSNRSPYYPVGIEDCMQQIGGAGSPLDHWGLDGGFRPPGIHTDGRLVDIDTYMRAYASAGVNLFRWSVDNCSFPLFQTIDPSGNVYSAQGGIWGDRLVQHLRHYGFRVYMTIFNQPPFADNPTPEQLAAIERYVQYVVDRYGPYVDFWELMNESNASQSWYQQVGGYLHRIDPYHHPVSTSWEEPRLPVIDITSPHWYETEGEFSSDADAFQRIMSWKQAGKPVIVGEQGNSGHNWDPRSAVRMRLRAWTAFFAEGVLIFWNASFAKDDMGNAIYLGPEERGYLHVLQRFTSGFDPRATIAPLIPSNPSVLRGSVLRGPRDYAAYLVNYVDHTNPTTGITVRIDPRAAGHGVWIDPASGAVLDRIRVRSGSQVVNVPPFVTDVALKVTP